jgi:hypothetical protein
LKKSLYVLAMMATITALFLLLNGCSSGQEEDQAGEESAGEGSSVGSKSGNTTRPPAASGPELQASLVPISHLTSRLEDVSTSELSQDAKLAVPRESQELAGQLLGRSDFEGYDSAGGVVDYVSQTPEATGLVPWDEVGPQVKALTVDGVSLFDPGAANTESYPLSSETTAVPDPEDLRKVVVAGDIVLDRGQPFAVFEEGRGIDFPLDGGYAYARAQPLLGVRARLPIRCRATRGCGYGKRVPEERRPNTGELREPGPGERNIPP